MSLALFKADVLFAQRLMASAGLNPGPLDGEWGAKTQAAQDQWDAETARLAKQYGTFDARTEACIATLVPKAQEKARQAMNAAKAAPFAVKILSGTRSYAEQDGLFARRPPVTRARGGQSNHNFGIAWDVGIFVDGRYYTGASRTEEAAYDALARIVLDKVPGVEWGGNWTSFVDKPHYQLATGKSVKEIRALLEQGHSYA